MSTPLPRSRSHPGNGLPRRLADSTDVERTPQRSSKTLETFFEKFDQFADAPGAVGKMRELILDLAIGGRLFESERPNTLDASKPFPIPYEWQWIALNEAADCRAATKVDSSSLKDSDWVLDLEDIDGGAGKVIATATFAERCSLSTKASFLKGDVLYGKLRPYLNKVVIAARPGFCTTEIIPLRPQPFVIAGYLRLFLRSPHFLRYAASKNYGMKMPRLGTKDLESAEIPLPPLAEQKRIVAKVDELMALCDRLEAQQLEREAQAGQLARASLARFAAAPTSANLQFLFHPSYAISPADLRKSILTLAVQGKLAPQDPNDEPAEKLLNKISAEQECLVKARQIRRIETTPLIEDEEPFEIPSTWAWARLGQIGDWGSGSTPPRGNHELYGGGITWLKSGELNDHQMLEGSEETVTEMAMKTCSFRLNKPGDVLLAMYGATIGKAAILAEPAVTNQAVCGCTPFPGVLNTYLFDYLLSQRDAFHAASEGGAQPNISKVKIVGYPFPLPPLAEQRRIVAKVEQLMGLVDALETQLAASRANAEKLLSALVAELTAG